MFSNQGQTLTGLKTKRSIQNGRVNNRVMFFSGAQLKLKKESGCLTPYVIPQLYLNSVTRKSMFNMNLLKVQVKLKLVSLETIMDSFERTLLACAEEWSTVTSV